MASQIIENKSHTNTNIGIGKPTKWKAYKRTYNKSNILIHK